MSVRSFLISVLMLFSLPALANYPDFIQESGASHYVVRSLGIACFSMTSVQHGLPCNPAAIALDQKAKFDSSIFIGSDLTLVDMVHGAMDNGEEYELYKKAATTKDILQAEASLSTTLMGPTRGLSVDPYRIVYYSKVDNPTLPFIEVVAAEQRSVNFQLASFVTQNWSFGTQFRYSHIKVIEHYFAATEAIAEQSEDEAPPWASTELDQISVEPGFLYQWLDKQWEPQVTAAVTNFGYSTPKSEAFPLRPRLLVGGSVKPWMPLGRLEAGLQLQGHSQLDRWQDVYRIAFAYTLGGGTLTYSYAELDQSTALLFDLGNLNLGFAYKDEHVAQSVFLQGGYRM